MITPTIGNIFPTTPPSGPKIELAKFPNGPSIVFIAFPTGAINFVIFPNPAPIRLPTLPNGEFATIPPNPDRIPPSLPPILVNGVKNRLSSFEPAPVTVPPIFPPKLLNTPPIFVNNVLLLNTPPKALLTPPAAFFTLVKYPRIPLPIFLKFKKPPVRLCRYLFIPIPFIISKAF